MRKVLFIIMTLILPVMTYGVEVDGINYELNELDKTAQVLSRSGKRYSGDLVIPSEITVDEVTYSITGIEPFAFNFCENLESVSIPEGVTALYEWTFSNCYKLDTVFIHKNLTHIDYGTFRYCSSLKSIVVDQENPVYDSRQGCNAIIMKDNDTLILGCNTTVIPEGVSYIGDYAFNGSLFSSIAIPDGVKGIGQDAFYGCKNLASINIPESVKEICSWAFAECSSLESIYIPKNVSYIAESAFSRCDVINSIAVDKDNAFYDSRQNCNAIIETETDKLIAGGLSTVIPDDVKILGIESFAQRKISSITIPGNVEVISDYAFYNCLELTSVTISEGVDSIGDNAFFFDEKLASVTIPGTVTKIGSNAFSLYNELKEFTCLADVPPVCGMYAFGYNQRECTLMVPENSISAYQTADVWKNFGVIEKIGGTTGVAGNDMNNLSVQVSDGVVIISGLQDGEHVSAYTVDGILQGTATAVDGSARLNLPKGKVILERSYNDSSISLLIE